MTEDREREKPGMTLNLRAAVAVINMDISGIIEQAKRADEALKKLDDAGASAFNRKGHPAFLKKPEKLTGKKGRRDGGA